MRPAHGDATCRPAGDDDMNQSSRSAAGSIPVEAGTSAEIEARSDRLPITSRHRRSTVVPASAVEDPELIAVVTDIAAASRADGAP